MNYAHAARISMIEDQLEILGWTLITPPNLGDDWTAENGPQSVTCASPESLLRSVQKIHAAGRANLRRLARPPAKKRGRKKGKPGRPPAKDARANLLRCLLEERPGLPCLALLWNRGDDLRHHLACHLGESVVKGLTLKAVVRHYDIPTDVADDGTGDLPEDDQTDPSGEPREGEEKPKEAAQMTMTKAERIVLKAIFSGGN